MQLEAIIDRYTAALDADQYTVQLIHDDRDQFQPIRMTYTQPQLVKSLKYLSYRNTQGYNIYCRPVGYQYVLLDDLKRDVLADLATIKPCLLIETSPANYQAWLTLQAQPDDRDTARSICRELCAMFGADHGSAEPDHVGRLPGFTNRKPKYQDEHGLYPFVRLHKSEKRLSTFSPSGLCAQKTMPVERSQHGGKSDHDRSRADFNTACMLIRQGKSDVYIRQVLEEQSEKAQERKDDYIGRTIANARRVVNK